LLVLLFGSTETKFTMLAALAMLIIALVQRTVLTPEIVAVGRIIDFIPTMPPTSDRNHFWVLHNVFTGMELLKWALGFLLTARLLFRRKRSADGRAPDQDLSRRWPAQSAGSQSPGRVLRP
jgi:hypothetical protein